MTYYGYGKASRVESGAWRDKFDLIVVRAMRYAKNMLFEFKSPMEWKQQVGEELSFSHRKYIIFSSFNL